MEKLLKLNLGGGPKKIPGYTNVDALEWNGATDIVHNLTEYDWPFEQNTVDEIFTEEFLEHISFKQTYNVLSECYRILKPRSKIQIQVPDCGKAMEYYVNGEICECVPHKAKNWDSFKADSQCFACGGKGKIHPNRWLFSFTGAGKHEYDYHLNIFTEDSLRLSLAKVGFQDIRFKDNIYKLVVSAHK